MSPTSFARRSFASLAALLSLSSATCGGAPGTCADLGPSSGVATQAALLRLELFQQGTASCEGPRVAGTLQLVKVKEFSPAEAIAVDLPAGVFVVHLVAYRDVAKTMILGEACTVSTIRSRESSCLSLTLAPAGCVTVSHDNGVGGTYESCAAPGTFDGNAAMAACLSSSVGATCSSRACSGGSGAQAICAKSATDCTCWTYTGAGRGTVRNPGGGGCECGQFGDVTWN